MQANFWWSSSVHKIYKFFEIKIMSTIGEKTMSLLGDDVEVYSICSTE